MNTRQKKWKYVLYATTFVTAFASAPINTQAVNAKLATANGSKLEITTGSNVILGDRERTLTTAGAADLFDADISMETEELLALVESKSVPTTDTKEQESTLVMAKVNEYVSIRKEAALDSETLGMLYKDCCGQLIEKGDEWSQITSGGVTGWVRNQYLYFGEEAQKVAEEVGILTARSNAETLRVRKEPSLDSEIIGFLSKGEGLEAIEEGVEWVSVNYEGTQGYVAAEFVTVQFSVDEAESMETIYAREIQEQELKAQLATTQQTETLTLVQRQAMVASASELDILAALIQCEAGGEPYEGQVAVGAVVMNRVRCPAYPNTITDVIYASGQFTPASGSRMQNLILSGDIKESCRQAAQEALNGISNVGDALYFRRVGNNEGIIIGNHVFW